MKVQAFGGRGGGAEASLPPTYPRLSVHDRVHTIKYVPRLARFIGGPGMDKGGGIKCHNESERHNSL